MVPLRAADVALAVVALDEIPLAPALELLSRAELERAGRIRCNDYRAQVVKARALLRLMLARLTGQSPKSFEFEEGVGRPPRLRVNPWKLSFSVSHSGDQIAVAVSSAPIGIDIEGLETDGDWQAVAETCFHPSERELLQGLGGAAAREAFIEIWTRKEAYLKAIGSALDTDPPSFSTVAPDGVVVTETADPGGDVWHTRAIDAPAGYRVALASPWPQPHLMHCRLDRAVGRRASTAGAPQEHEAHAGAVMDHASAG
jgi:4'-phosphopantetheinyl transferase